MSAWSLFVESSKLPYQEREACHGGEGPWLFRNLLKSSMDELPQDKRPRFLKMIHDDVLKPGSSFGKHRHSLESGYAEEWYICIGGSGKMTIDGVDRPMQAGDVHVCIEGEHAITNTGTEDMHILVLFVNAS